MGGVNRTKGDVGAGVGGVNLGALRSHNTALVLDLLRTAGSEGISRLELAERTGLTPQAVSKITARLREDGLATEAGRRASTGGKPRTVLRLVPEAGHAVGVHLDRDELTAVLCDLTGAVVARRGTPLDLGAGAETVVERVVREVRELEAGGGRVVRPGAVLGVGVALPGPLDHRRGVLHRVTGFPEWNGYPLRDVLARRLSLPVVVDKDTNAAALGLAVGGAGAFAAVASDAAAFGTVASGAAAFGTVASGAVASGTAASGAVASGAAASVAGAPVASFASFAYLHFGAGLGGGLVIGGAVHRGVRTGAGEFGHQVVQLDGPPCECGNRGCVEALCLAAVARGDLAEAARVLGTAAGNLVALLDVDLVLLGGRTVAAAPETFVRGVAAVLDERARRAGGDAVPVRVASGGGHEGRGGSGGSGVAEGAAQLLLAPLFGRAEG
ncbi:ROK family transcriptional regulator [Streptomyces cyaneochromogenes]|uniref:ROK family transcriptional regulator n=1 Tax=Streptomyces cyaneochromogenes TaxID=2496836 RepID=A0A3Q9ESC7_9ACTN|nr:ROK family transcriptional regulator [Streptomyces cyaneochromogenes]AZQ35008.1 ROK family transcriptional regulator [Streptomyces cyaneochromogenes]